MDRLVVMLSILFSIFLMAVSSSEATQPAGQEYWKKVLPNTPMPRAIKNLLTRAGDDVCKDCVTVDGGAYVYPAQRGTEMHSETEKPKIVDGGAYIYPAQRGTEMHSETEKPKGGAAIDGYRVLPSYGAHRGTKTHNDADIAIFFLEKDLQTGTKMTLHFTDPSVSSATFISRREANSLPFTSSKLPDILNHFSIEPHSNKAESMRQTLAYCERAALEGEKKYCATSLESMIDFITIALGSRNIVALSTSVDKENSPKQQYKITSSRAHKKMSGYNTVVCHALSYAYAVFYCHTTKDAETYHVSLVGKDGTNVKSVAICHTDTSRWDPAYIAFQVLSVRPGTVPICHLLPQNHVVWTPK